MDNFTKIIRIGARPLYPKKRSVSTYCEIKWCDGKLSICGVEGPLSGGDAVGGCGQIVMDDALLKGKPWTFAEGWSAEILVEFSGIWDRWHLNDLTAGSPRQVAWLQAHKNDAKDHRTNHYTWACGALADAGLNPDVEYEHNGKPYAYGIAWLTKEVPADVVAFLATLPDADRKPAWV